MPREVPNLQQRHTEYYVADATHLLLGPFVFQEDANTCIPAVRELLKLKGERPKLEVVPEEREAERFFPDGHLNGFFSSTFNDPYRNSDVMLEHWRDSSAQRLQWRVRSVLDRRVIQGRGEVEAPRSRDDVTAMKALARVDPTLAPRVVHTTELPAGHCETFGQYALGKTQANRLRVGMLLGVAGFAKPQPLAYLQTTYASEGDGSVEVRYAFDVTSALRGELFCADQWDMLPAVQGMGGQLPDPMAPFVPQAFTGRADAAPKRFDLAVEIRTVARGEQASLL